MRFGSLFAGIGGFDLGLERAGMTCAWQVEIDEYASKVLAKHWPSVPRFGDIRECGRHNLTPVDLICGGFPCQDISRAGNRAGITGARSALWGEMYRIIWELRPRYALVENVADLLIRGMGAVLGDLAAAGYDAEWQVLSPAEAGLPHLRERVFLVAYPCGSVEGLRWFKQLRAPEVVDWQGFLLPNGIGEADGLPSKVDRLRGLGNAVVPQVAQWIGERIMRAERDL